MKGLLYGIGVSEGLLGLFCLLQSGRWEEIVTIFLFYTILITVTFLDIDRMEIPDVCSAAMGILAVISIFSVPEISLLSRIIGIFSVSIPMLLLAMVIPGAIGGGDVKLMAAGGLFLGWKWTLLSGIIAVLSAGIYSILLLLSKKAAGKDYFPLGPFLCLGMASALPFGQSIIKWFLH